MVECQLLGGLQGVPGFGLGAGQARMPGRHPAIVNAGGHRLWANGAEGRKAWHRVLQMASRHINGCAATHQDEHRRDQGDFFHDAMLPSSFAVGKPQCNQLYALLLVGRGVL